MIYILINVNIKFNYNVFHYYMYKGKNLYDKIAYSRDDVDTFRIK